MVISYKNYNVIQICDNNDWGVCLAQNDKDKTKFGIFDYSFETDSVYDFVDELDIYTALDLFVGRMPITYGNICDLFEEKNEIHTVWQL